MKCCRRWKLLWCLSGVLAVVGCSTDEYRTRAMHFQEAYRRFLRDDPTSPVPLEDRVAYRWDSLFYPYNARFRMTARAVPFDRPRVYRFEYADGTPDSMIWWGTLYLPWADDTVRLQLFLTYYEGDSMLFLPFYDATNGTETYGGGRYLDIPYAEGAVVVDFNTATHPYCAYSEQYSCMLPPVENTLPGPVRAGERLAAPSQHAAP